MGSLKSNTKKQLIALTGIRNPESGMWQCGTNLFSFFWTLFLVS